MIFEGIFHIHLHNFPAENILILNSEEFYEHPSKILDIVFHFLRVTRRDGWSTWREWSGWGEESSWGEGFSWGKWSS